MPVTLVTNCCYTLSLGDQRLRRLLSESREQATYMGVLDQIKDWFYSGQKKSSLNLMFTLLREMDTPGKLADFKSRHGELLKKLFQNCRKRDLITFWHALDDQGHSLVNNAISIGDSETVERCLSLLDFFPLGRFDGFEVAELTACQIYGREPFTVLGLAMLDNRPDMAFAFLALHRAVTDKCWGLEIAEVEMELADGYVFGEHIYIALRLALRSARDRAQFDGIRQVLEAVRRATADTFPWIQCATFNRLLRDIAEDGEFGSLKSALRNGDNPALISCFETVLSIADLHHRQEFWTNCLQPDFFLILDKLALNAQTETDLLNKFKAFDRYVALYGPIGVSMPENIFCVGNRSASVNIATLLALALKHRQTVFSSWLLKLLNEVNLDTSVRAVLSSLTIELFNRSDWSSLEFLFNSAPPNLAQMLLEVLFDNPDRLSEDAYREFIQSMNFATGRFVMSKVDEGNRGTLSVKEGNLVLLLMSVELIVEREQAQTPAQTGKFMLENNGFFVQLMAYCTHHEIATTRALAARLYDQYLKLDALLPHAAFLARYCGLADGIRSSSSEEEIGPETDDATLAARAEKNPIQRTDRVYIFVCPKPGQGPEGQLWTGVLLNQENIESMFGQQDVEWPADTFTEVVDIEGRREVAEKLLGDNVAQTYRQFPVFAKRYNEMEASRLLKKLFQIIDLNYIAASEDEVSTDYTGYFLAASAVNKMSQGPKFIDLADQERLKKIFGKYLIMPVTDPTTLEQVPTIRSDHLKKIYALYGLVTEPGTAQDKIDAAQTLFCLATLFCRFSSQSMFGVGSDSPSAIRYYAGALLKQAFELAPSVVKTSSYLGFMDALYGLKENVQTCTDVLSRSMADYIRAQKSPQFEARFFRIKPAAWQLT